MSGLPLSISVCTPLRKQPLPISHPSLERNGFIIRACEQMNVVRHDDIPTYKPRRRLGPDLAQQTVTLGGCQPWPTVFRADSHEHDHRFPAFREHPVCRSLTFRPPIRACSFRALFNNPDIFIRQIVQLIHQPVNLPVGGVDLAFENGLVMGGLRRRQLREGGPADITIFNPDEQITVDASSFASLGRNTPFDGFKLKGRVLYTIVNGIIVLDQGELYRFIGLSSPAAHDVLLTVHAFVRHF